MMLSVLALVAALAAAPQAAAQTPGLSPSPDCGGLTERIAGPGVPMRCVTAPMQYIPQVAYTFAGEAQRNGWVPLTQTSSSIWLQKPLADGKCDRMIIFGFWDVEIQPESRPDTPGYVGVVNQAGQTCLSLNSLPAPNAQ
jgi:hypothetical protein